MSTRPRYILGTIIKKLGPVTYSEVSGGRTWKRHSDQIKSITYKEREVDRNDKISSDLSLVGGPTLQESHKVETQETSSPPPTLQESHNVEAQETSSPPKESPNLEVHEASDQLLMTVRKISQRVHLH